jgi:peroxiredoxin
MPSARRLGSSCENRRFLQCSARLAGLNQMTDTFMGATMLRSPLIALLATGLVAVASAYEVPSDPAKVVPLPVGSAMPAVTVQNADGTARLLGPGPLAKPIVLVFYRGGWCPYCNRHLGELKKIEPKLLTLGYELLSDSGMQAAHGYRVAFRVDDATLKQYREYGIDLQLTTGQAHPELPVPAVFVIDKTGVIRFVHANPDYTSRISPEDLLAAATRVAAPQR